MRMYFFVMYNISPIQAGIQAGHAALEYVLEHGKSKKLRTFIRDHKTFILLNGGTSSTMKDRVQELEDLQIKFSAFYEPDLNNSLSAIAFLVDEKDYADQDPFEMNPITQYLRSFKLASN